MPKIRRGRARKKKGGPLSIPRLVRSSMDFYRTSICTLATTTTSSAGNALLAVIDVNASSSSFNDLLRFVNLFQLMRTVGGRLHYKFYCNTPSTQIGVQAIAGVGFDTNLSGSLLGTGTMMGLTYRSTPTFIYTGSNTPVTSTQNFGVIPFRMPPPSVAINSSDSITSSWHEINAASTPAVHSALFYIDVASGTNSVEWFVEWDVEFKSRIGY
jgi:hypothetical protein